MSDAKDSNADMPTGKTPEPIESPKRRAAADDAAKPARPKRSRAPRRPKTAKSKPTADDQLPADAPEAPAVSEPAAVHLAEVPLVEAVSEPLPSAGHAPAGPAGDRPRRRRGSRSRGRGRNRRPRDAAAAPADLPGAARAAAVEPPARPVAESGPAELPAEPPEIVTDASAETVSGIVKQVPPAANEPDELDMDTLAELELQAAEAAVQADQDRIAQRQGPVQGGARPALEPAFEPIPGEMPPRRRRRRRRGRGRRGRGQEGQEGQAPPPQPVGQPGPGRQPPQATPRPPQAPLPAPAAQPVSPVRPLPPAQEDVADLVVEDEEGVEAPVANKIMLVNLAQSDECRIAMLEEGLLQEFYVERTAALSHVGNVYKGVITNVEPSIQAAFIDFGEGKNGFLHISDLQPQYFPGGGEAEDVGRKTPRRDRPPIQKCLRRNQEVVVQVTKEGIGTKGATLTTYIALPGRYLVMMPGMSRLGVSRKIEDEEARRKMRDVLNQLELPGDMGFILRTAGMGRNKRDLQRDLNYLVRLWKQIMKRKGAIKAPAELYQESDLVTRTLRDVVTTDVQEILVDSEPIAESARQFLRLLSPRLAERVKHYTGAQPLFFKYGVEDQLAMIYSKRVPLRSGGYLFIESTEALVAIDVNSGKFRETPDPEESAFRINLEAAEEIARQLSLRDLGGVIICDFIDMHMERHRREIERALRDALKKHKERAEILRMSRFGIIEMTRQRQRTSIVRSMLVDCPHCGGGGLIKSTETLMLETLRAIQTAATHPEVARIEVRVNPQVAQLLLNSKRQILAQLESESRRAVVVLPATDASANKITVTCVDSRGWAVQVPLPKSLLNGTGSA
jgi:Rne/Rng family ribonuclease